MAFNKQQWSNPQTDAEGGDTSRINAAAIINFRTQNMWNRCVELYIDAKFDEARDLIDMLWAEFYADASPEQVKKIGEMDTIITNNLKNMNASRGKQRHWLYYHRAYARSIYNKLLFLKTVEKTQGSGKAYVDKDADDWD